MNKLKINFYKEPDSITRKNLNEYTKKQLIEILIKFKNNPK